MTNFLPKAKAEALRRHLLEIPDLYATEDL